MFSRHRSLVLGCSLILHFTYVSSFYLPGAAPHDYVRGDKVDLYVNALTPMLSSSVDSKLVCASELYLYRVLRLFNRNPFSNVSRNPAAECTQL